jgi:hypothetical protein
MKAGVEGGLAPICPRETEIESRWFARKSVTAKESKKHTYFGGIGANFEPLGSFEVPPHPALSRQGEPRVSLDSLDGKGLGRAKPRAIKEPQTLC